MNHHLQSNLEENLMPILLFDGHCNLCNAWVQFIVKRDSAKTIRFASLQSKAGRRIAGRA